MMASTGNSMIAAAAFVAVAVLTARSANAEFWPDQPWSGFSHENNGHHRGGPYRVAGFGDDDLIVRRRYWGGPYFVSCPGSNPPYETHRPPYPGCRSAVKIAARHQRHIRVRLK